ncbi:MAG TPA: acyltransferase [Solirubrobacteraceae bacterium]
MEPASSFNRSPARQLAGRARAAGSNLRRTGLRVWLFYLPGPGPRLMSWLRKRWVLFRNPHAHIEFNGPVYLGPRFSLDMPRGGTFIVGPGVEFRRDFRAELADRDARITIGAGCAFTYGVVIQCGTSIDIGEHCVFAQGVMIVDGSHRFRDIEHPTLTQGYEFRPIVVGDHVSAMSKATVIANIGERTFVGAGAVVTRPLPGFCVVAGVPARVIDYFGPPGQEPPEVARSASAETAG